MLAAEESGRLLELRIFDVAEDGQGLLDYVIVAAQHHDRHAAARANAPERLDAADAGHHHVEHDDVVAPVERLFGTRFAVVHAGGLEAVAHQVLDEHRREFDVVIDEQDARHGLRTNRHGTSLRIIAPALRAMTGAAEPR